MSWTLISQDLTSSQKHCTYPCMAQQDASQTCCWIIFNIHLQRLKWRNFIVVVELVHPPPSLISRFPWKGFWKQRVMATWSDIGKQFHCWDEKGHWYNWVHADFASAFGAVVVYKYSFSEYPWDCFFPKGFKTSWTTWGKIGFALSLKTWTIPPWFSPAWSLALSEWGGKCPPICLLRLC